MSNSTELELDGLENLKINPANIERLVHKSLTNIDIEKGLKLLQSNRKQQVVQLTLNLRQPNNLMYTNLGQVNVTITVGKNQRDFSYYPVIGFIILLLALLIWRKRRRRRARFVFNSYNYRRY